MVLLCWTAALRLTHSVLPVGTVWVSSACLCRACSSTAGGTPMSEEQRFMWAERLFWDLNLLPQMGQSGTAGGRGGGAGALSSLSSKHLQREIRHSQTACKPVSRLWIQCDISAVQFFQLRISLTHLFRCCVRPSGVMCDMSLWQI